MNSSNYGCGKIRSMRQDLRTYILLLSNPLIRDILLAQKNRIIQIVKWEPALNECLIARSHNAISCAKLLSNPLIRDILLWTQYNSTKESYDTNGKVWTIWSTWVREPCEGLQHFIENRRTFSQKKKQQK